MAHMFQFRGRLYSVSDKNEKNEFVVIKFTKAGKIESARVIPAGSEAAVEKMIKFRTFEKFKLLEGSAK